MKRSGLKWPLSRYPIGNSFFMCKHNYVNVIARLTQPKSQIWILNSTFSHFATLCQCHAKHPPTFEEIFPSFDVASEEKNIFRRWKLFSPTLNINASTSRESCVSWMFGLIPLWAFPLLLYCSHAIESDPSGGDKFDW